MGSGRRGFPLDLTDKLMAGLAVIIGIVLLIMALWGLYAAAALVGIPWYVVATAALLLGHLAIAMFVADLFEGELDEALCEMRRRTKEDLDNIVHAIRSLRPEAS